jgi:hypothetical protein
MVAITSVCLRSASDCRMSAFSWACRSWFSERVAVEHGVGALAGFVDRGLGDVAGLGNHLVGVGPGVTEDFRRLGLSAGGEPVGGVLSQAEHPCRLQALLLRRAVVNDGRGHGRHHGHRLRLVHRDRLRRHRSRAGGGQLGVEFADPLTQIGVLLDEPRQLRLDQIEEGVHLVLVVATLADGRLAERHIVHVGRCQWHCVPLPIWDGGIKPLWSVERILDRSVL